MGRYMETPGPVKKRSLGPIFDRWKSEPNFIFPSIYFVLFVVLAIPSVSIISDQCPCPCPRRLQQSPVACPGEGRGGRFTTARNAPPAAPSPGPSSLQANPMPLGTPFRPVLPHRKVTATPFQLATEARGGATRQVTPPMDPGRAVLGGKTNPSETRAGRGP